MRLPKLNSMNLLRGRVVGWLRLPRMDLKGIEENSPAFHRVRINSGYAAYLILPSDLELSPDQLHPLPNYIISQYCCGLQSSIFTNGISYQTTSQERENYRKGQGINDSPQPTIFAMQKRLLAEGSKGVVRKTNPRLNTELLQILLLIIGPAAGVYALNPIPRQRKPCVGRVSCCHIKIKFSILPGGIIEYIFNFQ